MSFIFTNQASRHGLSVLLLLPRFLYLSFFFLSLFDFVVLLSLASLFNTALALSGQSEKAAIFCKGCYAALHGHRSRYDFMFFVHLKYLERFVTLWLIACYLVTRLLVTMYARSKSIGAVDYSQFPAISSDSKCRGCEAKVCYWHANSFWSNIIWATYDHHHQHQVPRIWRQGLFAGPRPNIF